MATSKRDITKETITHLEPAPNPPTGTLLEVRTGKPKTLVDEPSAIFKQPFKEPIFCSNTGLVGDEHVYWTHGGTERALHQYASEHYEDWRCEETPKPELFDYGGFGENLVGTGMNEENVCVGDIYRIGDDITVEVGEPRSPCYKLNLRFQWRRALKRVQRTGRVGWNMRVLTTGYVKPGDRIVLLERPNPQWSLLNVKRVIQGRTVPLHLLQELAELEVVTDQIRGYAARRLMSTPKRYKLTDSQYVTSRVKLLTFELNESLTINYAAFEPYAFAQIEFGPDFGIRRSYSIVSGDLNKFCLGVAYDDHSRGGSKYIHEQLRIGDEIRMAAGGSPEATENEAKCSAEDCVSKRVVIIGGIGVTAFMPAILEWEKSGLPYEVHYAARSSEQAAFLDRLSPGKTALYAKSKHRRLNVDDIIYAPVDGIFDRRLFVCGPTSLMEACRTRAESIGYPAHLLHFESFGADGGGAKGEPFEVEVEEVDTGKKADLDVPSDKSLLRVLRDAGFDMTSFCEVGGCGACKVTVCEGQIEHRGSGLKKMDKGKEMLSCVSRGKGKIRIELD